MISHILVDTWQAESSMNYYNISNEIYTAFFKLPYNVKLYHIGYHMLPVFIWT